MEGNIFLELAKVSIPEASAVTATESTASAQQRADSWIS